MDDDDGNGGAMVVPVNVPLPAEYFNRIEEIVARTGASREAVIVRLIGSGLAQLDESDEGDAR